MSGMLLCCMESEAPGQFWSGARNLTGRQNTVLLPTACCQLGRDDEIGAKHKDGQGRQ